MSLQRRLALAYAVALCACAPQRAALPAAPVAAGGGVQIVSAPVPLDPRDPGRTRIGDFAYAGGLRLTSTQTSRLHGLSDLLVQADGRLTAVSDEGDLLESRILLDHSGRLVGLGETRITTLAGLDGAPLQGKEWGDAEGMARLPDGDLLVSFEQHHRVWLYPAAGGPPQAAPAPQGPFPTNSGMEGLTADPAAGPDAYAVAIEATGETFACRLSAPACARGPDIARPADFSPTAMRRLPGGRTAYLLRAFDPLRGPRAILSIVGEHGEVGRLEIGASLSVDNFEGMDAAPQAGGAIRFYIISDDNFSSLQRTLLLAFDWKPKTKGAAHEPS